MNEKYLHSVDGFVLRRRTQRAASGLAPGDEQHLPERFIEAKPTSAPTLTMQPGVLPPVAVAQPSGLRAPSASLPASPQAEMDESLRAIDGEPPRVGKKKHPHRVRRVIKRLMLLLLVAGILIGGYTVANLLLKSSSVVGGNLFGIFENKALKADSNGRTNILLFGTSEDDPAHIAEGSGTELTDSIMVMSLDQKAKTAAMFSIPRDLWVKYGEACAAGYEGKINAVYECGKGRTGTQKDGAEKLMSVVGSNFGIDFQYYAQVNYAALKDAVNAVGGITVRIDSDDPRGVYDPNFDWQCGYRCKMVKWPNGDAQLDGDHALALARARNAAGGYGLGGGNFDREQYQQKIILALRDKAVSAGTLTNPVAVNSLINTLGNNVRTNLDTSELRTAVDVASGIQASSIIRINLVEQGKAVVTTGRVGEASVVRPVAGLYDFSAIKAYITSKIAGGASSEESADIVVLNGSDTTGVAGIKITELAAKGITATASDTPTQATFKPLQWYDLSAGAAPKTKEKLRTALGGIAPAGTSLPAGVQAEADFVIIIGNGAH